MADIDSIVNHNPALAALAQAQLELVPIDSLIPDPDNARDHPDFNLEAIKASLLAFGQRRPILVSLDPPDIIVAGNGTHRAARELGWTHIWIIRTDLTGDELEAYGIADNQTGLLARWDYDVLGEKLKRLAATAIPIKALGFDYGMLQDIIGGDAIEKLKISVGQKQPQGSGDSGGGSKTPEDPEETTDGAPAAPEPASPKPIRVTLVIEQVHSRHLPEVFRSVTEALQHSGQDAGMVAPYEVRVALDGRPKTRALIPEDLQHAEPDTAPEGA